MNELMKQYDIDEVFYKRYIQENARQRLGMEIHKFLFFKEGRFINPMKKNEILQTYCEE